MNFWARVPLNLVADLVKNSVPPLLRTLRFYVGGQRQNYIATALTTWRGGPAVSAWSLRGFGGTWVLRPEVRG